MNKPKSNKEKKLKHVKVYNRLYSMIKDGTFPAGSQLPSEPDLAVQMDVSRMTLRKALALLQEDHLIQNIHGKGNFIKEDSSFSSKHQNHQTAESILHPIKSCCNAEYDHVESEFRIELPSDYMKCIIKQNSVAIVVADRWYKKENDAFSYSLSIIPIEIISKYNIRLEEADALLNFLEEKLYTISTHSVTNYSYTNTGNFTSGKYAISNHSNFILIQETLYDKDDCVLLFNKYYIPLEYFNLKVYR